jgi:hypothetical protein
MVMIFIRPVMFPTRGITYMILELSIAKKKGGGGTKAFGFQATLAMCLLCIRHLS